MIDIKTYSAPKGNGESNGGTSNTIIINNGDSYEFEPHNLWGQYFDDTEDIDGDLTSSGTITGNTINGTTKVISPKGEITQIDSATGNITNINSDLINTKNINVTVQAIIKLLQSENITCDNLTVTKAAHFFQLIIDEIKATQGQVIITPASAKIEKVTEADTKYICYWKASDDNKTIYNQFEPDDLVICQTFNLDKQSNLIQDSKFTNLVQNWNASDTWLTADYTQASASGGVVSFVPQSRSTLLAQKLNLQPNTQYNLSFEIKQDVASLSDVSVCFHLPVIDTTKPMKHNAYDFVEMTNTIQGFDFDLTDEYKRVSITFTTLSSLPSNANLEIYCYDRNTTGDCKTYITNPSLFEKSTSNKYYWRKVIGTGTTEIDGEQYNYIELSKTDYDNISNDVPEVGDEIVQLGNKTDKTRQAAIVISAYNNQFLDPSIAAPSIVQYSGINDYDLKTHRLNVISKSFNLFNGNFTSVNGDDILTLIQQTNSAITTEVSNRINGDIKYFPIIKPFYDYEFKLITEYKDNPIRYYGDSDIYSTPTYVTAGTYKIRVFFTDTNLQDIIVASYGSNYPSDLSNYNNSISLSLGRTYNSIKCKDNTTLYEFTGEVTISTAGYYSLNFWEDGYLYIPDMENEFETNYSRITQTANKISLSIYDSLRRTGIDVQAGTITLNADNTDIVGNLNLDDTGHGLTMYDTYNDTLNGTSYKIPKVNIQPSDISPYNSTAVGYNDMFDRLQWNFNSGVSATSSDSSYKYFRHELTFLSQSTTTISLNKNDMIVFKNGSCQCWKDSNSSVGSPYWLVEAYNQTTGNTYKCIPSYSYMTYLTTLQYKDTSTYKFNIPEAGTYKFYITLRFSSSNISSSNLKGFFQCAWLRGSNIQTFMGNDGFYSRANPFTAIYSSKDETRLQNGLGGLRVRNNDTNLSGTPAPPRIEVGTTYAGSFPSVKPLWIPIWNYTPVHYVESTDYVYKTIYYNNESHSHYVYDVPANINGIIVLNTPPMDSNGNYQDALIRLPNVNTTFADSDGNYGYIPNGYTIKIINDLNVNVTVIPYRDSSSSTSNHTIRDANGNYNEYFAMDGEQNRVTSFIKLTPYSPYRTYWFADKDT